MFAVHAPRWHGQEEAGWDAGPGRPQRCGVPGFESVFWLGCGEGVLGLGAALGEVGGAALLLRGLRGRSPKGLSCWVS